MKQLWNSRILVSSKTPIKVIEECKYLIAQQDVIDTDLVYSKYNCKIIVDNLNYQNTYTGAEKTSCCQ